MAKLHCPSAKQEGAADSFFFRVRALEIVVSDALESKMRIYGTKIKIGVSESIPKPSKIVQIAQTNGTIYQFFGDNFYWI